MYFGEMFSTKKDTKRGGREKISLKSPPKYVIRRNKKYSHRKGYLTEENIRPKPNPPLVEDVIIGNKTLSKIKIER